jgi:glutamate/tyrosine decarboxylase-like PLP-dependent enzyme
MQPKNSLPGYNTSGQMKQEIRRLEKLSGLLEPNARERKRVRREVLAYSDEFLRTIRTSDAHHTSDDDGAALLKSPISEEPASLDEVIGLLQASVHSPGLNPASPGHLGYIPGGGLYYSALGDYLAAVFDRYAAMFGVAPGTVRMENMLIRWLAQMVGFPKTAAGNLTTGGSLAHLIGIVTARDAMKISSCNVGRAVIYHSPQAHDSIDKAIRITGLKECLRCEIPTDAG